MSIGETALWAAWRLGPPSDWPACCVSVATLQFPCHGNSQVWEAALSVRPGGEGAAGGCARILLHEVISGRLPE